MEDNEYEFIPNVKRRPRHKNYMENRKRVKAMLSDTYGPAFMQDNQPFNTETTATGKVVLRNPCDNLTLERKKWELSLTNNDILMLFRSLSNGSDGITAATLNRKLQGEIDFNSSEIFLLSTILELSPSEILSIFHLCPNQHNQTAEEID